MTFDLSCTSIKRAVDEFLQPTRVRIDRSGDQAPSPLASALKVYKQALQLHPLNPTAWHQCGLALGEYGDGNGAAPLGSTTGGVCIMDEACGIVECEAAFGGLAAEMERGLFWVVSLEKFRSCFADELERVFLRKTWESCPLRDRCHGDRRRSRDGKEDGKDAGRER